MAVVLVVGGTGTLGRHLVPALRDRGHTVRVLSRSASPSVPAGTTACRGDVRTGEGLDLSLDGVDTVIDAVAGRARVRETELAGMGNLLRRCGGRHLVYVSIVGVDRHRFPYYRVKWEAEQLLERSGTGWTVQRATQFHPLVDRFLRRGWFVRTPQLRFQPVDPAEVSTRLADLVEQGPAGRVPDFGGPEVLGIDQLAAVRAAVTGRRTRLVPLPPVGFLADFGRGLQLCPDHLSGTVTWEQWLRASLRPGRGTKTSS